MDSFPKSFNPNKQLKEEFVSNLTGTFMLEVAVVTTMIPLLFLVRRSLGFMGPSDVGTVKKDDDAKVGARSWHAYMVPFVLCLTKTEVLIGKAAYKQKQTHHKRI